MQNTQSAYAIEVSDVWKSFKTVQAVAGISLQIKHGEFIALLGPNGAGKTTLVEMIEGVQKPDKGEIRINGKQWHSHPEELHQILGISFQETKFIEKLRVVETLRLFASFYGLKDSRVDEVMQLTGLTDKRKSLTVNLSGGQRQKLALSIALLNSPKILLLDEPTTGLDPVSRREIWDILFHLKKEDGTSMILTTHYMEEAEVLCEKIIIIDKGKILAQGTLAELLTQNNSSEIIEFRHISKEIIDHLPRNENFISAKYYAPKDKIRIEVKSITDYLPLLLQHADHHKISLQSLECRLKTLDDLFITMTGRRLDAE